MSLNDYRVYASIKTTSKHSTHILNCFHFWRSRQCEILHQSRYGTLDIAPLLCIPLILYTKLIRTKGTFGTIYLASPEIQIRPLYHDQTATFNSKKKLKMRSFLIF